jgi:hypothetical protein
MSHEPYSTTEASKLALAKVAYEASQAQEAGILAPKIFEDLNMDEVFKWMKIVEAILKALNKQ